MATDDLEKTLAEAQSANQQLQALLMQKQTMTVQRREIELALEEVEKAKDDVYKSIGPIIMKSTKEQLKKELAEMKEQIELHMKTIDKQEKRIKDSLTASQAKLQQLMKPSQTGV
jgi:prefoldin beta subunit